jgi:hypothetical protein
MKNLLSFFLLAILMACGAPTPEGEAPEATDDPALETAVADDPLADEEDEGEDEEIEIPPDGALPLSEVLSRLEAMDYTPVIEAELEDGVWEIEYVVDGEERKLRVDPLTGEILPEESEGNDSSF